MDLLRLTTPADFLAHAGDFLLAHEAEHGLMLGVASSATAFPASAFAAVVYHDGAVRAAALRTTSHLILSRTDGPDDVAALELLASAPEIADIPSLHGAPASLAAVMRVRGGRWQVEMRQGLLEARSVEPARPATGSPRWAVAEDLPLLTTFVQAFVLEAVGDALSLEQAALRASAYLDDRATVLWEDRGQVVTMAKAVNPTPNGIRVSSVYTAPAHRGRGHAASLVAFLTQHWLDAGRLFVFLYTDLANPTSNSVYRRIGYRQIAEAQVARQVEP